MFWELTIFKRNEFWALLGVVLGFALTEITRLVKEHSERKKLKEALFDELEINYYQLEHKKDTLKNIIISIDKKEVLPGVSVELAKAVYDHNIESIILLLKPLERDIIENVYSRMNIIDKYLNSYEQNLMKTIKDNITANPWKAYKSKSSDIIESCKVTQELIKSVMEKRPKDIYNRKDKTPLNNRIFAGLINSEIIRKLGKD